MVRRIYLAVILICLVYYCIALESETADSLTLTINSTNVEHVLSRVDSLSIDEVNHSRLILNNWIVSDRTEKALNSSNLFHVNSLLQSLDVYRATYHFVGLNGNDVNYSRHGFRQYPSIWSNALIHQFYSNFFDQNLRFRSIDFGDYSLPGEVAVTDIQAGLGDYEYNYARVGFHKNRLLSFPNLHYNFDAIVQTGVWTSVDHDQSSIRNFLSYNNGKYGITIELVDWAQDSSSQDLLPIYWQANNFTIDHKIQQIYSDIQTPILDFAILNTREKAKAAGIDQENSILQYRFGKSFDFRGFHLGFQHERTHTNLSYSPLAFVGRTENFYQNEVNLGVTSDNYEIDSRSLFFFSGNPLIEGTIFWKKLKLRFGLYGFLCYDKAYAEPIIDIYNSGLWLNSTNQIKRSELATFFQYRLTEASTTRIQAGLKNIQKAGYYNGDTYRKDIDVPYIDASIDYVKMIGAFSFRLKQSIKWQQNRRASEILYQLTELPVWRYMTYMELRRTLDRENAIFAGLSLIGHSNYYTATALPINLTGSGIVDLWAGIQISNLFDLSFTVKNVLNTDVFGTYPIQQSIHAGLHWYFLN